MNISLIIIYWNTPDLLLKQLEILSSSKENLEIIVVDNSANETKLKISMNFPQVEFIEASSNRGFAGAANIGMNKAKNEWLLFLNPDVLITPEQIFELIARTEEQKLVASSPASKSENYQKPIPSFLSLMCEFSPLKKFIPDTFFHPTTLLGGCLLIKKSVLEDIHGWDERFFLWYEDSDLSKKLHKNKYKFDIINSVEVSHEGGASFSALDSQYKKDIFFLSQHLYAKKYFLQFSQWLLSFNTKRFARNLLLPVDKQIEVSIVVPNMKYEVLVEFLEKNLKFFNFSKHELIIVTSNKRFAELQQKFPQVIFIYLYQNNGFAETVNIGLQRARGKYIGTVNDDTVFSDHWIDKLVPYLKDDVASASPQILTPAWDVESQGIQILPQGKAFVLKESLPLVYSEAFNGACVLFNRKYLEKVGLFDESFGSYLEDLDLGLRFVRAGGKNVSTNTVQIAHFGQQTSKNYKVYKHWLDVKNWWKVMLKNYPVSHWAKYFFPILIERARNFSGLLKASF